VWAYLTLAMGILTGTSSYLVGPVELDPQASDWRDMVTEKLATMGVVVLNPMKKPKWVGRCLTPQEILTSSFMSGVGGLSKEDALSVQLESRQICLRLVHATDWAICYLPKTQTIGSIEELAILSQRGVQVFFVCKPPISMWLTSMFISRVEEFQSVFFGNWDALFGHLDEINKGKVPVDPLKWVFLTWNRKGGDNDGTDNKQA